MNRGLAKRLGVVLQVIFLVMLALLIYSEQRNDLGWALVLVVLMFGTAMGMLFASEKEEEQPGRKKATP